MTKNVVTKKYMSDNEKFADVFNYVLYGGSGVIKPEELKDCDANELLVAEDKTGKIFSREKVRDIKKNWIIKMDNHAAYIMIGIENQTHTNYTMPVRNMLYDVLEYESQLQKYAKQHRKVGDLNGDEYISGFSKKDKLIPVVTLVIYFGADKWDGPRTLHEMFDIKDDKILEYVSDYRLNLIEPAAIEDTEKFKSDFRYVVDFIKNSKDKNKLRKLVEENREYFSKVPNDTAMLIKCCADVDVRVKEEEEETNMCKAIEDMKEDAREEVRQEMRKELEKERREKQKMCKAIEDMKEDAKEKGRQEMQKETLNKLHIVLELHNKELISSDEMMEMMTFTTEKFQNVLKEIMTNTNIAME